MILIKCIGDLKDLFQSLIYIYIYKFMPAFSKHVRVKDNINIFKEIQNKDFYNSIREIEIKQYFLDILQRKKKKIIKM